MPTKWSFLPDHGCSMPVTLGLLADETSIERVAREAFGYSALRPGQREAVEALQKKAAGGAAQITSTVGARAREEAFAELSEHALEFVFLAPEQLARQD